MRPEPWLLRHLGPPPGPDASAALRADYELRAAVAASYREAAGITDPNVSLGEVPRGVPELAESWRAAARALEIPDELAAVRRMSRADLEALTARYEQVQRAAPVEVSRELRAADLAAEAAEAEAGGLTQEAADHRFAADVQAVHAMELTGRHEIYRSWQDHTAPERHEAELAAAELARRKAEREAADRQADAPEREPEVAPERKVRRSLWEQVQADLANLEALEAKLNRDVAEARAQAEAEALEAAAELAAEAPAESVPQGQAEAAEMYGRTSVHEPAPREPEAEARSERIDAHLAELGEAQAVQAARAASRDAAGVLEARAEAVAEASGAWVPGREAPGYEAAPAPEAEAELLSG